MQIPACSAEERLEIERLALSKVLATLRSSIPLSKMLVSILEQVGSVIPQAQFSAVMLWDQSSGLFRPWASFGCDPAVFKRIGLRAGESITGKVYEEGRPVFLRTPEEVENATRNMRP